MVVAVAILKPIVILMMPPLEIAVNPAVLPARHAVVMGLVVAVFDAVMLPVVPVVDLMMLVMMPTPMLRHGRRCEGQHGERTQGSDHNFLHGETPLPI